jgi:endonuclease IV
MIGFQLAANGSLDASIRSSHDVAQIFLHGPRGYARNKYSVTRVRDAITNKQVWVHSAYPVLPFGLKSRPEVNVRAVEAMVTEATDAHAVGAKGLIVHTSKRHPSFSQEANLTIVSNALREYERMLGGRQAAPILIEMQAMHSMPSSFETPEKMQRLLDACGGLSRPYSICLDTAHIWAAGVDLQSKSVVREYARGVNGLTGVKDMPAVSLLHFNGNKLGLGCGDDIHTVPGSEDDMIWNNCIPSLRKFAEWPIPKIIEVYKPEQRRPEAEARLMAI